MKARSVRCEPGVWTRILFSFGVGLEKDWKVTFTAEGEISGEAQVFKALWVFPRPPQSMPIRPNMVFQRDWVNGIFWVKIKPSALVHATIEG